ncbi:MAG: AAA family ATPase [Candidatus Peribacteraceae bacterium]|nr:AAA family ATPase [Candidatus Peribacteraceae bacterium]
MSVNIPNINGVKIPGGAQSSTPSFVSSSSGSPALVVESTMDMLMEEIAYRVLIFGIPSTGKTHFCLDMPEPVIILYTEDRFKLILGKFKACNKCSETWSGPSMICPGCKSKNIRPKDIRGIGINTMQSFYDASKIALELLNAEKEKTGKVGTIAIDSYTESWVKAREEHVNDNYGGNKDIKLSMRDDYKDINPRHNNLRYSLMNSGFNICLTATQGDLYGEDHYNPIGVRPEGQKHNPYAVDWYIFMFFAPDGTLKARLEKNGVTKRRTVEYPDFSFKKLQRIEEMFRQEEQMITTEILKKLEEEGGTVVPEPEEENKDE